MVICSQYRIGVGVAATFALQTAGCWSSVEHVSHSRNVGLLPYIRVERGSAETTDFKLSSAPATSIIALHVERFTECTTTTIGRYQTVRTDQWIGENITRSIIAGSAGVLAGGGYAAIALDDKDHVEKNTGPIIVGGVAAAAGLILLTRGIYHASIEGTERSTSNVQQGRTIVARNAFCDRGPVAGEEFTLMLETNGGARSVPLGATNQNGRLELDIQATLANEFANWPNTEQLVSQNATIVYANDNSKVVSALDLAKYPASAYAQHVKFTLSAPQRRQAEELARIRQEELASLRADEASFLNKGLLIKSRIVRRVDDTRHCVNILGRVPCEAVGAERRGDVEVTHAGSVTITNQSNDDIIGLVRLFDPEQRIFEAYGRTIELEPRTTKTIDVSNTAWRYYNANAESMYYLRVLVSVISRRGIDCTVKEGSTKSESLGRYEFVEGEKTGKVRE
ncbi:hypothetical protein [Sorangium sp. So ce117]|uniref:hypothetical protein n=1 Tax=Sorangium sp. So ce117 TaxID=3133277 RepID=UPI003F62FDC1